jgi:acetyl-CoA carboxylase / biotin carboxylase 1
MAAAEINGNGVPHTNGTVPIMNGSASYAAKHNIAEHFIGGNKLENAPAGPVKDFVASHDGHTVITNVSTDEGHNWQRRTTKQLDLTNS